ncbi:type II toxin-antitoxin system VapC family toxin [Oceanibaculum indicum]|uniref:PIN domain nuclease of toxin-antitoxin system n=1 Tax=Oceanibaculum indicum TaxID=526216 RepID=A0A420WGS0_9PROT|nr:type II toxin-antitoxin system VapC family toxin [Oceanibaculum indicum]RKQ70224.1 PIN domain nuclease of toxin-antitoxin system [Oceanibaculum indicum]
MSLLLDTHALLWWLADSPQLGRTARAAIADPASAVWVSAATVWEIAIKTALGRLEIGGAPADILPPALESSGFRTLPIGTEHALAAGALPPHHADPFDRMLIAQASLDGLRLVSADREFAAYGVPLLDAGR